MSDADVLTRQARMRAALPATIAGCLYGLCAEQVAHAERARAAVDANIFLPSFAGAERKPDVGVRPSTAQAFDPPPTIAGRR